MCGSLLATTSRLPIPSPTVIGFDKANQLVYMKDSRGRNTSALVTIDPNRKDKRLLAADPQADAADVLRHPTEKHVQAVSFIYDRKHWQVLDPAIQPDLDYLHTVADSEAEIISRTLDDRFWTVAYVVDDARPACTSTTASHTAPASSSPTAPHSKASRC